MADLDQVEFELATVSSRVRLKAEIRIISKKEAAFKALKMYLASLVLAFVSGFIPFVHFVAVPGLLVLGPVLSLVIYRFFKSKRDLLVSAVGCLSCSEPISLSPVLEAWPIEVPCPSCGIMHKASLAPNSHS